MGKKLLLLLLLIVPLFTIGQNSQAWDTIKAPSEYDNIYSRALYSDSLSSSFIIFIKKEVKKHKHQFHTEHVYILEGEGEMLLGEKQLKVKRGDILFIPKNTIHSLKVTSKEAVKVLSIQSPYFDGKDRILIE
ncbi:MAG: cupin domain-containing protein [Bacteroidetes bacterium]|jgi:mannose-6-phosphate isomerase-like protein (cupin superfamily)|nr:cupin domain-containing protein [Bacteroidota bacterium]